MLRPMRIVASIGAITRLYSLAFLVPVLIAVAYDPYDLEVFGWMMPRNAAVFLGCFGGTYLLGTSVRWLARSAQGGELQDREAYLTVGLGWLWLVLISMVPFLITGVLSDPIDAMFETMSGLTTTGATVMTGDLDAVVRSVMIWRALLQFIGGMGIIVLSVAVLARLTQGGLQILQAEAPGPSVTRIAPRLAQTARILWGVYLLFAGVLWSILFILLARRMPWSDAFYDALLHTFTTMSTGGFSNHGTSIAFFDSWLIEAVLILFMLIAGTNFTLHFHALRGRWQSLVRDSEWRFYLASFAGVSLLIAVILWWNGKSVVGAVRDSSFTVASLITSTGFGTADFDQWPAATRFLLLLVMVTGATAGSTGGGMKHVRILLLFKVVRRELTRIRHPSAVVPVRLGGRVIKPETVMATVAFFFAFVAVWVFGTVYLVAFDPAFGSIVDAASASISALSNMGPGLGVVGPTQNYATLEAGSRIVLAVEMWLGRLEIFTALLVFNPDSWRN